MNLALVAPFPIGAYYANDDNGTIYETRCSVYSGDALKTRNGYTEVESGAEILLPGDCVFIEKLAD